MNCMVIYMINAFNFKYIGYSSDMNIYRIEKFISIYNIYKDKFIKILNTKE